ncbi:hypothetical protein ACFPFV_12690 [Salinicoccus siamensis]
MKAITKENKAAHKKYADSVVQHPGTDRSVYSPSFQTYFPTPLLY